MPAPLLVGLIFSGENIHLNNINILLIEQKPINLVIMLVISVPCYDNQPWLMVLVILIVDEVTGRYEVINLTQILILFFDILKYKASGIRFNIQDILKAYAPGPLLY